MIRSLGPQAVSGLVGAKERLADVGPQFTAASQALEKKPLSRMSTLGTAGVMATGKAMQGDLMGALSQGLGGLGGGAVASALVNNIKLPGPLGVAAKIGAPIIGSIAGGNMLEAITGGIGAKATETSASPGGPDISVGGIPLTEAARQRLQRERDVQAEVYSMNALGNAQRGLDSQALAMGREDTNLRMKAAMPYIEKMNRDNLVNAQAKLASEGAMYQALGRQAGQYKLAQGAQAETGATMRAAMANPYLGATLSAPSISFG